MSPRYRPLSSQRAGLWTRKSRNQRRFVHQDASFRRSIDMYMVKQRSRWLAPLMSTEPKSSPSSLSVFPSENSVDSFITLMNRMDLLIKLRSNASGIEENSKRKSKNNGGSVPWGGPLSGRTSNAVWPSPGPFYRASLCFIPIFPTEAAPGAHNPACELLRVRMVRPFGSQPVPLHQVRYL